MERTEFGWYTWSPWRMCRGHRMLVPEAKWRQPVTLNRKATGRVKLMVSYDVFEDWDGPIVNHLGQQIQCEHIGNAGEPPAMMTMQDVRVRLFNLINQTPNLDWLLLTKRPENITRMMPAWSHTAHDVMGRNDLTLTTSGHYRPRHNVWLGTSVEDQQTADERIPHLLSVPAAVRFLSMEPLLGPVDIEPYLGSATVWNEDGSRCWQADGIDWVIVGGESGPHARPIHPEWVRSIRDQCQAAGVPFFFKQMTKNGQIPDDLMIRQFPEVVGVCK